MEGLTVAHEPKLFVGQVPLTCTEADITQVFAKYGTVEQVTVPIKPDGSCRGFSIVRFAKWAHAEAAMESLHGSTDLGGDKPLVVKFADPPKGGNDAVACAGITPKKLFVGQIPKSVEEAVVRGWFEPFGNVTMLTLRHSQGAAPNCAFVTFARWSEAEEAMGKLSGARPLDSMPTGLVVKFADGKPKARPVAGAAYGADMAVGQKRGNLEDCVRGTKRVNIGSGSVDVARGMMPGMAQGMAVGGAPGSADVAGIGGGSMAGGGMVMAAGHMMNGAVAGGQMGGHPGMSGGVMGGHAVHGSMMGNQMGQMSGNLGGHAGGLMAGQMVGALALTDHGMGSQMGNANVGTPMMNQVGTLGGGFVGNQTNGHMGHGQIANHMGGQMGGPMGSQMGGHMNNQMGSQMSNMMGGQMVSNQMLGNQMMGNQMIGNQMMGNQMMGNQMMGNQVMGNQMMGNQMMGNQVISSQMMGGQMMGGQAMGAQLGNGMTQLGNSVGMGAFVGGHMGSQMGSQMPTQMANSMVGQMVPPHSGRQGMLSPQMGHSSAQMIMRGSMGAATIGMPASPQNGGAGMVAGGLHSPAGTGMMHAGGMGGGMAASMGGMNAGSVRGGVSNTGGMMGMQGGADMAGGMAAHSGLGVGMMGGSAGGGSGSRKCPWKLFVGQVPYEADESDMQSLFAQYGDVHDIQVLRKPGTGQSRGCGFVTYAKREQALLAIENANMRQKLPNFTHARPLIVHFAS